MKVKKCSSCGGEKINVFAHYIDNSLIGFLVNCPECGLSTKDYKYKNDAIRTWNNPLYLKEERK